MKLKNISSTVVSVGRTVILPDEVVEVTDRGYENNDALNFLIKTNRLALVKEREKVDKKTAEPKTGPTPDGKPQTEKPKPGEEK